MSEGAEPPTPPPHRRRPRYAGKNPRRFEDKYKERQPELYPETIARVLASGKTPAGAHRPIMVAEILGVLQPRPGELAVDCTLGYGGHAQAILERLRPGGQLIALDADPIELPKTVARLERAGFTAPEFTALRSNFAGLPKILAGRHAHLLFADLGLSSMQIDDPARGFSVKAEGPLDMRMNPQRGQSAADLLRKTDIKELAAFLHENADEPHAELLAGNLARHDYPTTRALRSAIEKILGHLPPEEREKSVRRTFQALRIAVNDEFSALDSFLRVLPQCLAPGGRAAILTFHSGEDRRVKKGFADGLHSGAYSKISLEVLTASAAERHANPRATSAKLRWAKRAG